MPRMEKNWSTVAFHDCQTQTRHHLPHLRPPPRQDEGAVAAGVEGAAEG